MTIAAGAISITLKADAKERSSRRFSRPCETVATAICCCTSGTSLLSTGSEIATATAPDTQRAAGPDTHFAESRVTGSSTTVRGAGWSYVPRERRFAGAKIGVRRRGFSAASFCRSGLT